MALSDEQLLTLADDIAASQDPGLQALVEAGNHQGVADWYNEETEAPDVYVWKSIVTRLELVASMDWDNEYDPETGSGFKEDIPAIDFIVDPVLGYDPRPVESRNALNAVFSGAGTSKSQILQQAVRICSRAEALYIIPSEGPGGGDGSAANKAALATYEGLISSEDARKAIALIP